MEKINLPCSEFRVGQGIDIHQFAQARKLILAGVEIPHTLGLAGHSDADVVLHAVIDAMLGATGRPDIGTYFPDSDEKWRGCSSMKLLQIVWSEIAADNWQIVNLDITVLAQLPKIAPYIGKMKESIGLALGIGIERCAIKATTTERLGFVGREEGILASCVLLLERKKGA